MKLVLSNITAYCNQLNNFFLKGAMNLTSMLLNIPLNNVPCNKNSINGFSRVSKTDIENN